MAVGGDGAPRLVFGQLVSWDYFTVLGVEPVVRDDFAQRAFPDDPYDLTPASFGAVDETLHDPGLRWGAAKAHVHMARRRRDGCG